MAATARRRSLRTRLLASALVLVLAALVVAGLAIGVILHRFVRGQLDGRLDAQIVALRAGLEAGILPQGLDAPPFDRPGPGWAWEVRRGAETIRSGSLRGGDIRLSDPGPDDAVAVVVDDDGPGLDPAAASAVMARGRRLDEGVPGHGFGLPITLELAELYGGGLSLGRSDLGGLRAELRLPA
ncbi:ATP-binding protein [Methylobacterium oryzae]|uniref:ATP-binding protein n=1 Tax=Methylobacterium oryzae TaxID=334852 RepID=UPI002F325066